MSGRPRNPYHIDEQYADALLRPIGLTLAELDERLTQYVDRLYLADGDRARVEQARELIADTRRRLRPLVDSRDDGKAQGEGK